MDLIQSSCRGTQRSLGTRGVYGKFSGSRHKSIADSTKQTSDEFFLQSNIIVRGSQKITFSGKPLFLVSALQRSMTQQIFHEILGTEVDSTNKYRNTVKQTNNAVLRTVQYRVVEITRFCAITRFRSQCDPQLELR
jgi:hypothetical protein